MRGAFSASLRLPPPPPPPPPPSPSGKRSLGLFPSPARSLTPAPRVSSASKSLAGGSSANSSSHHHHDHQSQKGGEGDRPIKKREQGGDAAGSNNEEEEKQQKQHQEKQVHCEVEVVSWRETKVRAWVAVNADVATLWGVLTDYERLAEYIPNLVHSGRIPCPHKGRIWLEQRGLQRALYWQIEARVVLDLQEFPNSANGSELHFSMVDGDFKKFEGKWSVKAGPRSSMATLCYEVSVAPKFNFPAIFLERIIRSDLPVNLQALACIAERYYEENQKLFMARGGLGTTFRNPYNLLGMSGVGSMIDTLPSKKSKESYPESSLGSTIGSTSAELNTKWGVYGKVCRLDRQCMVDEIHLRRFDGLLETGGAHRCVIASITVKAPVREVWSVLTAYETLPQIVPNLAISKVLLRDNNKVRILQEGCKGLLYMVLHARVILDLHEKFEHEISFEQVEGDFDSFRGKWLLEQLGDQHTLLKYVVESRMHKDTFLSEAILEEVIYEDLPSNLCAIRDFVENSVAVESGHLHCPDKSIVSNSEITNDSENKPAEVSSNTEVSNNLRQRSKVPGLQRDIGVLRAELTEFISEYGKEGFMPMRKQLRAQGRVDIEKAITRMGGFRRIANLMNLSLAYKHRKPKGYWDNFENLQEEITQFQKSWRMDPAYMPSRKSFERAGRYDIARALEKWGGLQEVSRLLSLELRHPRKRLVSEKEGNNDLKVPNDPHCQEKMSNKPYVAQDTQKWLMKLKDLDINWVE